MGFQGAGGRVSLPGSHPSLLEGTVNGTACFLELCLHMACCPLAWGEEVKEEGGHEGPVHCSHGVGDGEPSPATLMAASP
jgi:hypothetical protein